jgi:hypothetical protein
MMQHIVRDIASKTGGVVLPLANASDSRQEIHNSDWGYAASVK